MDGVKLARLFKEGMYSLERSAQQARIMFDDGDGKGAAKSLEHAANCLGEANTALAHLRRKHDDDPS